MPSFDVVSKVDMQEVDNAVNQAIKELQTRYDFKGGKSTIDWDKTNITLSAEDKMKLPDKLTIKVNVVSLIKFVRKFLKWRRNNLIHK